MSQRLDDFRSQLAASPAFAETRLLSIFEFLADELDDVIHGMGGVEPVIVEVHKLYDAYVAPIDVPWIPSILEPTLIDMPAKQILAATIRRLHDRIHKD